MFLQIINRVMFPNPIHPYHVPVCGGINHIIQHILAANIIGVLYISFSLPLFDGLGESVESFVSFNSGFDSFTISIKKSIIALPI